TVYTRFKRWRRWCPPPPLSGRRIENAIRITGRPCAELLAGRLQHQDPSVVRHPRHRTRHSYYSWSAARESGVRVDHAAGVPTQHSGRRRWPRRLAGDKGYSYPRIWRWLNRRRIGRVIPTRKDLPRAADFDKVEYRK